MLTIRDIISVCFLFAGMFFCLTTTIGVFRLPDFYTRCHTSGNSETMGLLLTCIGFAINSGFSILSAKILILFLIVCICNPIGSHILARSAYLGGFPMTVSRKRGEHHANTHH